MKKYRKRIGACLALILSVAVIAGVVWNQSSDSYAHETFSGVSKLVSAKVQNNQEFVILEIVDDLEEASIGYLVEGQEPYANRLATMTAQEQSELIEELQERGLIATDELAEQSAYPVIFDKEVEYSTEPADQELLDKGYLQVVDSESGELLYEEVAGYFVAQETDDTGYEGYYRLSKADIADNTLTYADIVNRLQESYTGELFTTDSTWTAYQFVADETAQVPDLIENYEITVHRFGPITDENDNITYGYDDTDSDDNNLLKVMVTDDEGKVELSDLDIPDYLAEDGTKYQFSHYALNSVDGEEVDDEYVFTADSDVWAVYVEIPTDEYVVNVYHVEAVYDTDGTSIIEYRQIEGDTEKLVTEDHQITLPSSRTYEGYTFIGKYLMSDMLTEVTADYVYTANTDIYVAYAADVADEEETYEVTVHFGSPVTDGSGNVTDYEYVDANVTVVETAEDGTIELPAGNTVVGYSFVGFSATEKDTSALLDGSEVYTQDSDIYAVYEAEEPDATPTPTEAPDATPTPTEAPDATPTEVPDATPTPTQVLGAALMSAEAPDATPTPTEAPDATPTPAEAPDATPTPTQEPDTEDTARIEIDTESGALLASNGSYIPVMVLSGTAEPKPADMSYFAGYGYQFTYEKWILGNNNRFKNYVLGLEEGTEEFNRLNIRVITYTADGKESAWTNTNNLSLEEAIEAADLVYISGNGRDAEGTYLGSDDDMSISNVQKLFTRAANEKLPVMMDFSVYTSDGTTDNLWKLACLLLQEDLSSAYAGLNSTNFESNDWEAVKGDVSLSNGGNFVRDNVFCVNYQGASFNNSVYASDWLALNASAVYPLVNADFAKSYTDLVSDAGFARVYQAIQQENYERGQSGSDQASMNEYVSPAVAVAYILNFEGYDPIIYKDTIRVLELQPCRDYTYYYDGDTTTDAGKAEETARKLRFAQDWAPAFEEKLDSLTIDGMTTAEFCGKISDMYEQYDVIYFGSNTGLMNTIQTGGGFSWKAATTNYAGYISLTEADNAGDIAIYGARWEYENGTWYRSAPTGETRLVWNEAVVKDGGPNFSWNDNIYYVEANALWKWDKDNQCWMNRATTSDSFAVAAGDYTSDIVVTSVNIDGVWIPDTVKWTYSSSEGKWYYSEATREQIWSAREAVSGGLPYTWYNSNSQWDTADATWKWDKETRQWYVLTKEAVAEYTLYNDEDMNGMVYVHTGDCYTVSSAYNGLLAVEDETSIGFRYSGNDILDEQVEQLLEFLKSGSPIILASDFMIEDEDGNLVINSSDNTSTQTEYLDSGYTNTYTMHGILDTSSYVYQFVKKAYNAGYTNLLVEGRANEMSMAVALNQQKMTLNLLASPTEYEYTASGDELGSIVDCVYLEKEDDGKYYLNYEFMITNLSAVTPLTTRYDVRLYLDSNSDGIYNTETEELADITVVNAQTGEVMQQVSGVLGYGDGETPVAHYSLSANTPYTVRRELPEGYVGCIGWKLCALQVGNPYIHDSAIGLTAVKNEATYGAQVDPVTGKQIIHVLQITSGIGATNLDLEDQTTQNIGGQWETLLSSIPDFVVDFDTISGLDFAYSFENEGEYYDARNDEGKGGYLTGIECEYDITHTHNEYGRRNDYLNFYDYDMIIIGFIDCYTNIPSQRATEAIVAFGESGKSLLYTHDTTFSASVMSEPRVSDFSETWNTSTLSMSIRNQCGMDRYGVTLNRYEPELYAQNPIKDGVQIAVNGVDDAVTLYNESNDRSGSDIAYLPGSNQTIMAEQTQALAYGSISLQTSGLFYLDTGGIRYWIEEKGLGNHNRVTRVNDGIITQYPYTIAEEIVVSNTHSQYFQLDLDSDSDGDGRGDVVVWYCISSLDDSSPWNENGEFVPNDVYDFSPNDVRNSYYIYNKGNITYTGVGHEGNFTVDEMKLFINTFIAAYNAGVRNPSVRIVDGTSINAPDLEAVNIPFDDANATDTYRVYFQVKDNNITSGTEELRVRYCIGDSGSIDTMNYYGEEIHVSWFADEVLTTYDAITGVAVAYDQVLSGKSYYVEVPLTALVGEPESFDFYVEVDLVLDDSPDIAAYAVDKLTIFELKLFDLD